MIKAIIFDYDGVIVDSFSSLHKAYKKICKKFKVPYPEDIEEFRVLYGYSFRDCLKNLGIKEENFDEATNIYGQEIIKMKHQVFPGIFEILQELNNKYTLYVVSAAFSREVLTKLKKFKIFNFFKDIYCGADQKTRKSQLFLNLFKKEKLRKNQVLIIGDRLVDYDSAKRVGIKDDNIILVRYGWGLDESSLSGIKIADKPADILKLIKK